jgi:hypothetical protein
MPDDIEVTEQEEMNAFEEEAGIDDGDPDAVETDIDEKDPPETDDDDDQDKKDGDDAGDGSDDDDPDKRATGDDDPDKKKAEEPDGDDDDDPEKRLEKILEEREAAESGQAGGQRKEPVKEEIVDQQGGGEKRSEPVAVSLDQVNGFNKAISIDQLPDANIAIGKDKDGKDIKVNLREFADEEPEMFAMTKAVAGAMTGNILRFLMDKGIILTNKSGEAVVQPVNSQVQELLAEVDDLKFNAEVGYLGHPDYVQVNRSKEFADWLDTQPSRVRQMARALRTPEEAATILDLYKKSTADSRVKDVDDKARDKKAKRDALHRDTSRKPRTEVTKTSDSEDVDEQSAFEEEAAALDKRDKR